MAKRLLATLTDTSLFLQEWLANPQRTGAVVPSSRQLATAMAHWLPSDPDSFVLELGPGTGAVTQALLKHGLREDRLVAIERNPKMARLLHNRFPRARIINGDAWRLDDLLRKGLDPIENVGAVFSSLPLLNFPEHEAEALARKNPVGVGAARHMGAVQLSHRQKPVARHIILSTARLQNRLAESTTGTCECLSEVSGGPAPMTIQRER